MNYKRGDKGIGVRWAQQGLRMMRFYRTSIDSSFGPGMEEAVKDYQEDRYLTKTGTVNDETWSSLRNDVLPIQKALSDKGFYSGSQTGVPTDPTYEGLLNFQRAKGLTVDGFFGPATRQALYGGSSVAGNNELPFQKGDKGSNILSLQCGLTVLCCHPGDLDGSFGSQVEETVKVFEKKYGLTENGIISSSDWDELKNQVKPIQKAIGDLGYELRYSDGTPDTSFVERLKEYQNDHGLVVDGQAGPATRAALGIAVVSGNDSLPLKRGSKGYNVLCLQYALRMMQIDPNGFDGSFGGGCVSAVERYQEKKGLTADGVVGTNTWETLRKDIRPIQEALLNHGYDIGGTTDGIASPETYNAVLAFQKDKGLTVDGLVGTGTRNALGIASDGTVNNITSAALKRGSKGRLVLYLQKVLTILGYSPDVDGSYGPGMENQVKAFQKANGLEEDGKFGPACWRMLDALYHPGSGSGLNKLISVARHELSLGFEEDTDSNNHGLNITPYGQWYGLNAEPWCAMFVTFCAKKAGLIGIKVPEYCYCPTGQNWYKNRGRYYTHGSDYIPKPGDIIFFYSSEQGRVAHTGIVVEVTDTHVTTIEGNADNAVRMRTYHKDEEIIDGYGCTQETPAIGRDEEEVKNEVKGKFSDFLGFHGFQFTGSFADTAEDQTKVSNDKEKVSTKAGPGDGKSVIGSDAFFIPFVNGKYDESSGSTLAQHKLHLIFYEAGDYIANLAQDIGEVIENGSLGMKIERNGNWITTKILYSFTYQDATWATKHKYLMVTHEIKAAEYLEVLMNETVINQVWSQAEAQFTSDDASKLDFVVNRIYYSKAYRNGSVTWKGMIEKEIAVIHFSLDEVYRRAFVQDTVNLFGVPVDPNRFNLQNFKVSQNLGERIVYLDQNVEVRFRFAQDHVYSEPETIQTPISVVNGALVDEDGVMNQVAVMLDNGEDSTVITMGVKNLNEVATYIQNGRITWGLSAENTGITLSYRFDINEMTYNPYSEAIFYFEILVHYAMSGSIYGDLAPAYSKVYATYITLPTDTQQAVMWGFMMLLGVGAGVSIVKYLPIVEMFQALSDEVKSLIETIMELFKAVAH
ncbi:MAG: peptidoglycan-binding protein [Candidatus Pararuminococcus gallinarum]|jgi:peptidoglycan hydrolase-like protein with peptidoglycan-binding domain